MADPSARLLALLSLLQTPRDWPGAELAARLAVTPRTVRRDVERLRTLGYPVEATRGTPGYRLGAGAALPPLLLDDDEAVAVAISLRAAAASSVRGIEETALRALAKLEQVLPSRLRHRVRALQQTTVRAPGSGPDVDPDVLLRIAEATQRREGLRFGYTRHDGSETRRSVEPHALVSWGRYWYLVAWDPSRHGWRTFRVDRLRLSRSPGPRFPRRPPPDGDVTAYLARQLSTGPWAVRASVVVHEPAGVVADLVWPGMGVVEAVDERSCRLHVGAPNAADVAWMVTALGVDFTVTEPPEVVTAISALGERCRQATASVLTAPASG